MLQRRKGTKLKPRLFATSTAGFRRLVGTLGPIAVGPASERPRYPVWSDLALMKNGRRAQIASDAEIGKRYRTDGEEAQRETKGFGETNCAHMDQRSRLWRQEL